MAPAHRVSFLLFKGPIPKGLFVLHSCDIRHCVNPEHLRVGTHEENMRDALVRGHLRVKLTPEQVIEIRRAHANGDRATEIASRFKISPGFVRDVVARRSWKHI